MDTSAGLITGTYNYWLVALSFAIAVLTSLTALDLAARVHAHRGRIRAAWLSGGALAMGSGIWCMHYMGMLAYQLPIPVAYHLPTVILSLIAAVAAAGSALYVVTRGRITTVSVAAGSIFMGGGIAAMHYTGMAAMRMRAMHLYNTRLVLLSIGIAVAISLAGLLIIFYSYGDNRSPMRRLSAAVVLGLAVPTMHYTGMAAITFLPMGIAPDLHHSLGLSAVANCGILFVAVSILGIAIVTSLLDRRLSAQAVLLERERQMLRALIDNLPDFMFVKDTDCRFLIANPATAFSIRAEDRQDLIGRTEFDFFPGEQTQACFEAEQHVMRTGEPLLNHEQLSLDCAGHLIPFLVTKVPLRDNEGVITGIAAVGRDIGERKRNEEALLEAEKRYRGIFDRALFGIFHVGPQGHLINVNTSMALLLGYASSEDMLSTMTDVLWTCAVSQQRHLEFEAIIKQTGYAKAFEIEVFRKDRSTVWVSATVRSLLEDGVLAGFEGMCEDITERKLLRERLLQAQKLETVGQLAAGLAHEINTPTQYIGDNVRFLKDTFDELAGLVTAYELLLTAANDGALTPATIDQTNAAVRKADVSYLLAEIPSAIDQALEGITRISTLVSAIKDFSHPGMIEKMPLNINHAIHSTITVARNEWRYVADMDICLDDSLPLISCQPGAFNQVVLNLIVNAAHAIAERNGDSSNKGTIRVQTVDLPSEVEIRISDTGAGIPLSVRTRIFDPFFTTKEIGKGTGQGLAIARSIIVDKHAGSLDFETVEGKGTTFIIRLPHDGTAHRPRAMVQ